MPIDMPTPPAYVYEMPDHFVGEIGQKWLFPSDHLPIGATIDNFHIATWNVLNTKYIQWILDNAQGLRSSLIAEENHPFGNFGLTVREVHTIQNVLQMLSHPTHPRALVALQECSGPFIEMLGARLPEHIQMILSSHCPVDDQDIFLFDSCQFDYCEEESFVERSGYPSAKFKTIMNLLFKHRQSGHAYHIFNTHVPGDPAKPGRDELARYVLRNKKRDQVTIVLGDMNFNEKQMSDAFDNASQELGIEHALVTLAGWDTNVGPAREAKMIDHIFVDVGSLPVSCLANQPEEVVPGLQRVVDLLRPRTKD
jgi:hypothetical protein